MQLARGWRRGARESQAVGVGRIKFNINCKGSGQECPLHRNPRSLDCVFVRFAGENFARDDNPFLEGSFEIMRIYAWTERQARPDYWRG